MDLMRFRIVGENPVLKDWSSRVVKSVSSQVKYPLAMQHAVMGLDKSLVFQFGLPRDVVAHFSIQSNNGTIARSRSILYGIFHMKRPWGLMYRCFLRYLRFSSRVLRLHTKALKGRPYGLHPRFLGKY